MTATFLQTELQSLVQESKRKSPETRTAAEKSLADLKDLAVTSESQLSGDLIRRPQFVDPFILASRSRNVKLATIALSCLQRLAAGRAIPRERLSDVLDALRENAALGLDVQLKILQTLPPLLQQYSGDIRESLLAAALEICDTLQSSKTAVVSSTAEATFQQLVTTVYDRVSNEDAQPSTNGTQSVQVGSGKFTVRPAAHDAYKIFADLCALANGTQPTFVQLKTLSPHFLLEVIGSIATNYKETFLRHSEQLEVCRLSLLPALTKILATKSSFAVIVRTLRTFHVLLRNHLRDMVVELEDGIVLMVSLLEPSPAQPWKRVLCLEVFRSLFSDSSLFRDLYRLYDDADDREKLVGPLLAAFVRIASEDPALIGLGRQSTMPSRHGDTAIQDGITSFEASDIGGAVGGVVSASATVTGLSTDWSSVKVPCLEQLDKANLTDIPTTYVYSLLLNCVSALAEGLSRFVMPLSVPSKMYTQRSKIAKAEIFDTVSEEGHPGTRRSNTMNEHHQNSLVNPLTIKDHPQREALSSCARLLENCWPPVLATCSTFFSAALDAEYYHNLVRAFQKLTQVSGVLELTTARDALLTSLSKAAVPTRTITRLFSPSTKQSIAQSDVPSSKITTVQSVQADIGKDIGQPRLSVRNLLCLRALLNLGIALGPSLGIEAWFIILEALERAEGLISSTRTLAGTDDNQPEERPTEPGGIRTLFGVETAAVHTATKRMFESTRNYSDAAFALFITSLFRLDPGQDIVVASDGMLSPTSLDGTPSKARTHRPNRSISGLWINPEEVAGDQAFVVTKTAELAGINLHRFLLTDSFACSWGLLIRKLLEICASPRSTTANKLEAAEKINDLLLRIVGQVDHGPEGTETEDAVLKQCFEVLLAQMKTIEDKLQSSEPGSDLQHKSHAQLLATLESIIGQCGAYLTYEWTHVVRLISSAFEVDDAADEIELSNNDLKTTRSLPRSEAVLQRAFACLQLLVSDFLESIHMSQMTDVIMLVSSFGSQTMALNISLTTTTFYWNIASLLLDIMHSRIHAVDRHETNQLPLSNVGDARKIWMLLFSQMSLLGLDGRPDVRQSSIRMITKVVEAASDQLSPSAENLCLQRLLSVCANQVNELEEGEGEIRLSWLEAASQTLKATVDIILNNLDTIQQAPGFSETWSKYNQLCTLMLEQKILPLSTAVFGSLAAMVGGLNALQSDHSSQWSELVIEHCLLHHPADIDTGKETNQAALVQFIATIGACLSTRAKSMPDLLQVVDAVQRGVLECVHPPYTSDTKALAPEQEGVVLLLPLLRQLLALEAYTGLLLIFIKAPLAAGKSRTSATFVALAARASQILRETAVVVAQQGSGVPNSNAILVVLAGLISTKYTSQPQGGPVPLWRHATTTAAEILQSSMSIKDAAADAPLQLAVCTEVARSILEPGGLTENHGWDLGDDELFDISSFERVHASIRPHIGFNAVSTSQLKGYILTLFHASLVAEPFLFDFPDDYDTSPLRHFSIVRPGTVCDPVYAKRNRICYAALDTLFSLVAKTESNNRRSQSLAQIAAPYFLLRCAYTLKTFIADQPLRSICGLPLPLRRELLTILNNSTNLRCDPAAFNGIIKGDHDDGKAHLRLLNSLVVQVEECWRRLPRKVTGVNWQDRKDGKEIEGALARWRACVSEGWDLVS